MGPFDLSILLCFCVGITVDGSEQLLDCATKAIGFEAPRQLEDSPSVDSGSPDFNFNQS